MKKVLDVLVFSVAGLLTAGVIFVLVYPRAHPGGVPPRTSAHLSEPFSPAEASLFLGTSPKKSTSGESRITFRFGDKIYATVMIPRVEAGDHTLVFRWINPLGNAQETFRKDFRSPGGRYRCWSWLVLRGEELFPVSIGPFGIGRFLGRWGIRVYLDDLFLTGSDFMVV